jgi:hypothetical protein
MQGIPAGHIQHDVDGTGNFQAMFNFINPFFVLDAILSLLFDYYKYKWSCPYLSH